MSYLRHLRRSWVTASAIVASAAVLTIVAVVCSAIVGLDGWPPHAVARTAVLGGGAVGWGAPWEALALPPAHYLAAALAAQLRTLQHLAVAAAAIAALCLTLHALSRILSGWHALAVRHALGATTRHLLPGLGADLAALAAAGSILGAGAGAIVVAALAARWPVLLARPPLAAAAEVAFAFALVGACLLLAFVAALLVLVLQRGVRTAAELHGNHLTTGGTLLTIQSALAVLQMAGLLMVTYGSALLLADSAVARPAPSEGPTDSAVAAPLTPAAGPTDARAAAYRRLARAFEGRDLGRVAVGSTDAWLGMGKELPMLSLCEECRVGAVNRPVSVERVRVVAVDPGTLAAMGAPITRGRDLLPRDTLGTGLVAVLNLAAAYLLYPGGDPLRKPLLAGADSGRRYTVVGLTAFEAPRVFGNPDHVPLVFVAVPQHPPMQGELIAPQAWERPLRTALGDALPAGGAPRLRLGASASLARHRDTYRAPLTWFSAFFAVLALGGTGIALYSLIAVMTEVVRLRERDVAIRMAMGAQGRDITWWVARRTLRITAVGALLGVSGARWLGVLLHGPERSAENDVALLGLMILAFGAMGLVASWLPARRALQVAPAAVLADTER